MSGLLNLPGDRVTIGLAYAVESDLNDPENAFIIIGDQELEELRRNELDADGDGRLLIAPKRRTVWGIDGRLNLNDQTAIEAQIAFSALDENTFFCSVQLVHRKHQMKNRWTSTSSLSH